jgi:hypothetical protein
MAMTEDQLNALGEQVNTLTERLGSMTEALSQIVQVQSKYIESTTGVKVRFDKLAYSADEAGQALRNKAKIEAELEDEARKRETARKSADVNAIKSLESLSGALFSTEKGFGKFSGALGSAGDAAFELGKSFGLLGTVIGGLIKIGTSVGEMFLKQADAQNNFVTEVYKMGGISGQSSENLTDLARAAGYSAGELDKLTPSLRAAGRGLATLGTSTGDGTTALLKLFNVGNETEKEFFRLGYTLEELNKTQADYIELQRISGINLRARGVDEDKLRKQSLDYAKNLRELSDLTGKSAETLQQEQAAAQSAYENVVANRQDEARIRQMQTELSNETNAERRAQLEKEIAELENAGRVRNEAIGAMAGTLGKDFGEQFGRILRTGTFDELTGPLANLFSQSGLDPADIKRRFEGVEAGSDEFNALVADIQGNLRSGIDSSLLMLGDSIQFGGRQMGESFGLAAELIENSAVIDPDGQIQQARAQAIQNEIDSTMQAGDAQRDYAAATESFTRDMRVTADDMLDAMNPLTGQMDLLKGSVTALAVAVGAATLALGAMAAVRGGRAVANALRGARGAANVVDDVADVARTGSRFGRVAGTVGRLAGRAAVPLAVGMTAYDAYKGFTADPNASMSERFSNAGSSALSGLTFGMLGSDPNEIAARSTGEPTTLEVPSARESRIATERENRNRRIQLAREGYSRSEIESIMALNGGAQSAADVDPNTQAAVGEPVVPTAVPAEEPKYMTFQGGSGVEYNLADLELAAVEAARESGSENSAAITDAIVEAMYKQAEIAGTAPEIQVADEIRLLVDQSIATGTGVFARRDSDIAESTTARPVNELSTPEDFSRERDRLNELVEENKMTRQERSQALGELRNRENELAESRYEVRDAERMAREAEQQLLSTPTTPTTTLPSTPEQVTAAITPRTLNTVAANTVSTTTASATTATAANNNVSTEMSDIMSLLSYKLDNVISLLETGVTIQDRILLESRS